MKLSLLCSNMQEQMCKTYLAINNYSDSSDSEMDTGRLPTMSHRHKEAKHVSLVWQRLVYRSDWDLFSDNFQIPSSELLVLHIVTKRV